MDEATTVTTVTDEAAPQETLLGKAPEPAATPAETPAPTPAGSEGFDFRSLIDDQGHWIQGALDSLPEHLAGKKDHLAKYPGVLQVAEANVNLNTLLGKKSAAVVPPGPDATPEERDKFFAAIGRPSSPEGYGIDDPDGVYGEGELDTILQEAHGLGLTKEQTQRLVDLDRQRVSQLKGGIEEAMVAQEEAIFEDARKQIQERFGEKLPQAIEDVRNVLGRIGVSEEDMQGHPALRNPDVFKWLASLRPLIGNDRTLESGAVGNVGASNPYQEMRSIMTDSAHPMHAGYVKGEPAILEFVRSLHQSAAARGQLPGNYQVG